MDAKAWCITYLQKNGYRAKGELTDVRLMPWSQVYKVDTDKGTLFLKQVTKPFSIENRLIQHLSHSFKSLVPKIIGSEEDSLCFIMEDSGTPLRDSLKNHYDIDLAKQALKSYAQIQIHSTKHIEDLMQLGVMDWRLDKMPKIYEELLKEHILIEDGMSKKEISQLQALLPAFTQKCESLLQYSIPAAIEHGDFHDNNILLKDNHLIFNDWGDAVISHPFFSIISFLYSAGRAHGLKKGSHVYESIKSCYLECWQAYETPENLLAVFDIVMVLNMVKFVASFIRVRLCTDDQSMGQYHGVMASALKELIPLLQNM